MQHYTLLYFDDHYNYSCSITHCYILMITTTTRAALHTVIFVQIENIQLVGSMNECMSVNVNMFVYVSIYMCMCLCVNICM